jgi:hypothetical protein
MITGLTRKIKIRTWGCRRGGVIEMTRLMWKKQRKEKTEKKEENMNAPREIYESESGEVSL